MKDLIQLLQSFWPSLTLLALAALPGAYMVLHDTGKARWCGPDNGYFGKVQWIRKYSSVGELAPDNWYYRFFKIRYKERFLFSATFLISFVDAYHTSQLIMRILLASSFTLAIGAPWYFAGVIWGAYATVHAIGYKMLSR